ncbi:MAG TPA: response regulator transcription factor [Terriglobales bacterium]|jgi:DNA-binding NarL/FixJ family response regulator|nr:response regulator transcription factor [Terriglobales bacterium]
MPSHEELGSDFVSIVVADGTRIHTQLLADALRNDRGLQVAAAASNSEELMAAITRVPIDVVVIAHNLDDQPGHGTQVLREMRALRPQIKGVILLDSSKPQDVLECFRAGARGIFSKQERLESLCKCIRSVHEGQIWARSVDLDHALEALASLPLLRATNHKGIELLSARERQVIQQLAAGMTNREIALTLSLSPHTVKNYLFRIFDKLGVSSRTELLYLTMNNSQAQPQRVPNGDGHAFSTIIEAAEAGDAWAQLRLAEHFGQIKDGQNQDGQNKDGQISGAQPDTVSAYMWYLLAEKTAAPMLEQIAEGKRTISQKMSPQQLAEAEGRAAARFKNKKQSGFDDGGEVQTGGQPSRRSVAR